VLGWLIDIIIRAIVLGRQVRIRADWVDLGSLALVPLIRRMTLVVRGRWIYGMLVDVT
jgi:hypothetical protein